VKSSSTSRRTSDPARRFVSKPKPSGSRLAQIAELFGRDKSVISRHLRKVFTTGELEREATVAKTQQFQLEGGREVVREIEYFNLDAILSVGTASTPCGQQFRIWATRTVSNHLVRATRLNERRLHEKRARRDRASGAAHGKHLTRTNSLVTRPGVLEVVRGYTRAWRLLLEYDENRLPTVRLNHWLRPCPCQSRPRVKRSPSYGPSS